MAASYPSAVKSFSALNVGDTIQDTHVEDAYDEITAIEQALLTGIVHALSATLTTTNTRALALQFGLGAEATASVLRLKAYSPAIEFLDKDGAQNWHAGIDDNDADSFVIGRGYGPGQGLAPSIAIDKTALSVTIGEGAAASPDAILNIVSSDAYGQNDWVFWTRRHGTSVSNHSRFQHFSGAVIPEVVLSGLIARGSLAAPTAILSGDPLFILDARAYDGTATNYNEYANGWSDGQATIRFEATENWGNATPGTPSGAKHGTKLVFKTTPNSSGVTQLDRLTIGADGIISVHSAPIRLYELSANPSAADLTSGANAKDRLGFYMKNDKLVFAYNNAGTVTYISLPLDGATVDWTHSTSAP